TVLPAIDSRAGPSPYLEALVSAGKLGFKSGEGFRAWPAEAQTGPRVRGMRQGDRHEQDRVGGAAAVPRAQRSTKSCAADPGSRGHTHGPRISDAPFRFAPRCAASGERLQSITIIVDFE